MNPELYDLVYAGIAHSPAYRAALAEIGCDLPEWLVPLSSMERSVLERIAGEMHLRENLQFVDLACGLGGASLWLAQRTGANVVGVAFSSVAIREAARTGLPDGAFAAVTSIDALQFTQGREHDPPRVRKVLIVAEKRA
jgi:2-polyprenyl-3-methyl-5-hydroxy-6-metoxy-1,4-benzoquinol methylase